MRRRILKPKQKTELSKVSCGRIPMTALVQTLAVAEHFSFHSAALALGTSQSSVSARIRSLEDEIGIILFDRNTRGVRLTKAGRRFVDQIGEALGIIDRAIKTAGMQPLGEEGELRIGVHALMSGCFLDNLFKQFHAQNPSVRLRITEGTARETQIMLREGRLDLTFMACTYELPDLNSRVIWHDRLMVGLPTTHPLAKQRDVEWRQLAQETFLVRNSGTGPQVHGMIVARSAGKWPVPAILCFEIGRTALLSMIAAGHGISLFVNEEATTATANVAFLPIQDEPEMVPFSAVWSPRNHDPAILSLLNLASKVSRSIREPIFESSRGTVPE